MRGLHQIGAPSGKYAATWVAGINPRKTATVSLCARGLLASLHATPPEADFVVIACAPGTGERTLAAIREGRL